MRGTVKTKQFFSGVLERSVSAHLRHLNYSYFSACCVWAENLPPSLTLFVLSTNDPFSSDHSWTTVLSLYIYFFFFVLLLVYYIVQTVKCNIILYNFIEEKYL